LKTLEVAVNKRKFENVKMRNKRPFKWLKTLEVAVKKFENVKI